jgi:hypothetical protein
MQKREILYLLAVGQFRAGEYARSRRLVDQALQVYAFLFGAMSIFPTLRLHVDLWC